MLIGTSPKGVIFAATSSGKRVPRSVAGLFTECVEAVFSEV